MGGARSAVLPRLVMGSAVCISALVSCTATTGGSAAGNRSVRDRHR